MVEHYTVNICVRCSSHLKGVKYIVIISYIKIMNKEFIKIKKKKNFFLIIFFL